MFSIRKNLILIKVLIGVVCMITLFSCDDDDTSAEVVTEEEAVEAIEVSVSSESGGVATEMEETARVSDDVETRSCSTNGDSTITISQLGLNATFEWDWILNCSNLTPDSIVMDYTSTISYDGPLVSSSSNAIGDLTVSGLGLSATYTIAAIYSRMGTQTSKVGSRKSFDYDFSFNTANIQINKNTNQISSGVANVTISGTSRDNVDFSYSGTITFNGNQTATLVLDNGNTYELDWS